MSLGELDLRLLLSLAENMSNQSSSDTDSLGIPLLLDYDQILDQYYRTLPNADVDQHKRKLITYYLMGIGGMLVCCLGVIGNLLSLLVLTRSTMRLSTNTYLASLAVCDTIVLVLTMVLLSKDVDRPVEGQSPWNVDDGIYPHIFPYLHPLAFTFQVASIWLTLAFTVDRYIMICHPFKAEPFCTISRARKVVIVLYISAVVFNIPKYFEYETVQIPLPMQNATQTGYDLTSFGRSHIFREMYHSWFYIAFVCGIPFLSLAVLNAFLMHAVRLSRKRGKEINVADRKRNDTTVMLIGVVVVFFICQMPALVSRTIWAFEHDPQAFQRLPLYTLNEIGNFLIILNSAINIVPYYFFGRKFRREFWRLFCHCLLRYNKFQKLSRSFSLTILDQQQSRRSSQLTNTHCAVVYDSPGNLRGCLSTTPLMDKKITSIGLSSETVKSHPDWLNSNSEHSPIKARTLLTEVHSELNGNCLSGPVVAGRTCLDNNASEQQPHGNGNGNGHSPPRKCLLYINTAPDSNEHTAYADEEL